MTSLRPSMASVCVRTGRQLAASASGRTASNARCQTRALHLTGPREQGPYSSRPSKSTSNTHEKASSRTFNTQADAPRTVDNVFLPELPVEPTLFISEFQRVPLLPDNDTHGHLSIDAALEAAARQSPHVLNPSAPVEISVASHGPGPMTAAGNAGLQTIVAPLGEADSAGDMADRLGRTSATSAAEQGEIKRAWEGFLDDLLGPKQK